MGASNVVAVYTAWGATLGDRAMRVMTYMALIARDEHGAAGLAPGSYVLRRQREQADEERLVAD